MSSHITYHICHPEAILLQVLDPVMLVLLYNDPVEHLFYESQINLGHLFCA